MARKNHLPILGAVSDGQTVTITEAELGYLTQLAGWQNFEKATDNALRARGLSMPTDFRLPVRRGLTTVWRTAPDRVLVRSDTTLGFETSSDLAVLDLSEARICLTLVGPGAAGLLSRVIALDFSEAGFPVGTFAQTALHHVGVLVDRSRHDSFAILVPTTWATSLTSLLADHLAKAA